MLSKILTIGLILLLSCFIVCGAELVYCDCCEVHYVGLHCSSSFFLPSFKCLFFRIFFMKEAHITILMKTKPKNLYTPHLLAHYHYSQNCWSLRQRQRSTIKKKKTLAFNLKSIKRYNGDGFVKILCQNVSSS